MTALQIAPSVVSLLLLAAHFLRSWNYAAVIVVVLIGVLVFVRRPWAARTIQVALLIGTLEWVRVTVALVHARSEIGAPFFRLAIILGGVALFTLLAALLLQAGRAGLISASGRTKRRIDAGGYTSPHSTNSSAGHSR